MSNKMLLRSASTPIIKKSSWVDLKELSPQALVRSSSSSYFNSSWSPVSNSLSERRSPVSSISNSIKKISRKREEAENNLLLIRSSSSSAPNGCSEAVFHDPMYQETMVVDQELDQDYCSSPVGGSGSGGGGSGVGGGGSGGDDEGDGANDGFESIDEYYQKMIKANHGNTLLLGNYARFLKEVRGEVEKALEYCERAIIISGNEDGNVLSLYGELIWDAHKDASRAQFYFDQALLASPHDCYVMASYARFLWDAKDEDEDDEEEKVEEQEQCEELNNGNSSSPPPANFLGLAFPPPPPPIAAP